MNNEPVTSIQFDLPLPCSVTKAGEQLCGEPATAGYIYRHGYDGGYDLQPICKTCVQALVKLYGVDTSPQA